MGGGGDAIAEAMSYTSDLQKGTQSNTWGYATEVGS